MTFDELDKALEAKSASASADGVVALLKSLDFGEGTDEEKQAKAEDFVRHRGDDIAGALMESIPHGVLYTVLRYAMTGQMDLAGLKAAVAEPEKPAQAASERPQQPQTRR